MAKPNGPADQTPTARSPITSLSVSGFKSILSEQTLEIRPLTLIAGSNSFGKTSMLQPLLLLKQTLEAQYDPGPILLNGANVKFTSVRQFIPAVSRVGQPPPFVVAIGMASGSRFGVGFRWKAKSKKLVVTHNAYMLEHGSIKIDGSLTYDTLLEFARAGQGAAPIESGSTKFSSES